MTGGRKETARGVGRKGLAGARQTEDMAGDQVVIELNAVGTWDVLRGHGGEVLARRANKEERLRRRCLQDCGVA